MRPASGDISRLGVPLLGLLALTVLCGWQLSLLGNVQLDDAYITFSSSKNLAAGHGPLYSHLVRVESYSNFLWMLLVAAPLVVAPALDPLLIARVLTVPFAVLLGWAVFALIRLPQGGYRPPRALAWGGLCLLALDTDLFRAGLCGLETIAYVALTVAGFACYLRGRQGSRLCWRATLPCFTAAALMRIDGFAPLLAILVWELAASWRERRFRLASFCSWALPSVGVYVLWFLWRWHYYGYFLPNTYYAKALLPKVLPDRGWQQARDFLRSTTLYLVIPFLVPSFFTGRQRTTLLAGFALAHVAYVIHVGSDWMPFWRFFAVVVPLAIVLLAWGMTGLSRWLAPRTSAAGELTAAVAVLVTVPLGYHLDDHNVTDAIKRDKLAFAATLEPDMLNNYKPMARLLRHVVPSGRRLVSDYAGVMSYFTDAVIIDMWGLANVEIAHRGNTDGVVPLWGRTCPPCYPALGPDFFHVKFMEPEDRYHSQREVVEAVWQSDTIGRFIDFDGFVAGRAVDLASHRAIYFLQRRALGLDLAPRQPAPGILIDYPFEPAGGPGKPPPTPTG